MALLTFDEGYVERMWGGQKLRTVYGKDTPAHAPIGEAWMIADHPQHVSVVARGPDAGRTLRDLLEADPACILGSRAERTVHGRFPLLLKLIDAGDKLSIQVHPDDGDARGLGEPDVGKTEMWTVLQADPGSELYCGMPPEVNRRAFETALGNGTVAELLTRIPAREGTAVFVEAGTVHAIGGGCLLAEIQQNSDITYRIDDWGRVQADGTPRALHVDKALEVIHFGSRHAGAARPLSYDVDGATVSVLAACRYFAAELVTVSGECSFDTRGESFAILLGRAGACTVKTPDESISIDAGTAVMVTGDEPVFTIEGTGSVFKYFVPDLERDVIQPLLRSGHPEEAVVALGGDQETSDLAG